MENIVFWIKTQVIASAQPLSELCSTGGKNSVVSAFNHFQTLQGDFILKTNVITSSGPYLLAQQPYKEKCWKAIKEF